MKKLLVLAVVSISLISGLSAQMNFGVKAGIGFGSMRDFMVSAEGGFDGMTFPDQYFKNVINFYGGISVKMPLNDTISFESGLYYAPRSGKLELDCKRYDLNGSTYVLDDRDVYEYEISTTYLEMPLLVKFNAGKFAPYAGVSGALLISNEMSAYIVDYDYDVNGNQTDMTVDMNYSGVDINECLKAFVVNAQFGLEYTINDKFVVDVRYVMGLTSVENYYGATEDELTVIDALPTAERQQWYRAHPFLYVEGADPDAENNNSIETANLYVMVGYKLNIF